MTVAELIEKLSAYPPNAPVRYAEEEGWSTGLLDEIQARRSWDDAGCKVFLLGNNITVPGIPVAASHKRPAADAKIDAEHRWSESDMTALLDEAAKEAVSGAGCSDVVYTDRFSASVDHLVTEIPQEKAARFIQLARGYEYLSPQEREQARETLKANRDCRHGLDEDTCPAGCYA